MKRATRLFDTLAKVFLGATILACLFFLTLLVLPSHINPFAEPTWVAMATVPLFSPTPAAAAMPLPTEAPAVLATGTYVVGTALPRTPTRTPRPTFTPSPSYTPSPTEGPSPTITLTPSEYPFTAEIYPQLSPYGCNWAGIQGLVFDLEGNQARDYVVHVYGYADVDTLVQAGTSQFRHVPGYGLSAWDVPINASGMTAGIWFVQLHKLGESKPYSEAYEIRLGAECGLCSMFVKFVQNH